MGLSLPAYLCIIAHLACDAAQVLVNEVLSPLAIDVEDAVVFRWSVGASSNTFALAVYASSGAVWNATGANASVTVMPPNLLRSSQTYAVTVNVTSAGSQVTTATASFGTGPSMADWQTTSWIGGFKQMRRSFQLPAVAQMSRATASQPAAAEMSWARLHMAAAGCYEAWLNGVPVSSMNGTAYLNPGFSAVFSERLLYQTFDVTNLLQLPQAQGQQASTHATVGSTAAAQENVLGLRLGNCKYGLYTEFCAGNETACTRAAVRLVVQYTNGSNTVVTSDGQWTADPGNGPITYDHLYNGESYDATLEQAGWAAPGFDNASAWVHVGLVPSPTAYLSPHLMPPVTVVNTVSALSITKVSTGVSNGTSSFVFDYGRNHAGTFRVSLPGAAGIPRGTVLTIRMAERLMNCTPQAGAVGQYTDSSSSTGPGSISQGASLSPPSCGVYNAFPCPAPCCPAGGGCSSMIFKYTVAGTAGHAAIGTSGTHAPGAATTAAASPEVYSPTFSSGGFRWLQLDGWPDALPQPDASVLVALWLSSEANATASVAFGSSVAPQTLLNDIQDAVVTSLASNLLSHPTDCPTRERRGWMGDAQVSVDAQLLNFRAIPVYLKWLRTMADTQAVGCGTVMYSNNTCAVFHEDGVTNGASGSNGVAGTVGYHSWGSRSRRSLRTASSGWTSDLAPDLHNGPGQRPDCYLCCSAKAGFGCDYLGTNVTGSLPDIAPVNGPSRAWPGSICWTAAIWRVATALTQAQGDAISIEPYFPAILGAIQFYNEVAAAGPPGLGRGAPSVGQPANGHDHAEVGGQATAADNSWETTGGSIGRVGNGTSDGLLWYEAYGDWLPIEPSSPLFMANAHYYRGLQEVALIASAVGQPDVAAALLLVASDVRQRIQDRYLQISNATGKPVWDTGSQAASAIALVFGLSGQPLNSSIDLAVGQALVNDVVYNGFHLTVGMLGSRYLLEALSLIERDDIALPLANQSTAPGWGYFVSSNGTNGYGPGAKGSPLAVGAMWESWTGTGGTSLNHAMLGGGIGVWLYERALGLRVEQTVRRSVDDDSPSAPSPSDSHTVHWEATGEGAPADLGACLSHALGMPRVDVARMYGFGDSQSMALLELAGRCGAGQHVQGCPATGHATSGKGQADGAGGHGIRIGKPLKISEVLASVRATEAFRTTFGHPAGQIPAGVAGAAAGPAGSKALTLDTHVLIGPSRDIARAIKHARGHVTTAVGPIELEWRWDEDAGRVVADVRAPAASATMLQAAGEHVDMRVSYL